MSSLEDLLGKLSGVKIEDIDDEMSVGRKYKPITPDTIAALRDLGKKYIDSLRVVRIKVGDIVTSRKTGSDKFHGQPMLVIEVADLAGPYFDGDIGSTYYGRRPQIRVLVAIDDKFLPFWGEVGDFEPYVSDNV